MIKGDETSKENLNWMTESKEQDERGQIAQGLELNLAWLESVLNGRFQDYFATDTVVEFSEIPDFPVQNILPKTPLEQLIAHFGFAKEERLIIMLALCPLLQPQILDVLFIKNGVTDRAFSEFGGHRGKIHSGFLPTAETAMFLLAVKNIKHRLDMSYLFDGSHPFFRHQILDYSNQNSSEPGLATPLVLTVEMKSRLLSGEDFKPDYSPGFPAKRMQTKQKWTDLVLEDYILEDLEDIKLWLKYREQIMEDWGLSEKLNAGFKSLFHGPPGTGKTFAATLLGKETGYDVYRIDLSMVVSKWIGETEKNLASVFDQAENKNWILFFDEADALFGKRTTTSSSNDRYANQEVSYLLQRVEDFTGVVILATNFKTNLDKAFVRRFQSIVQFAAPDKFQRLRLWENAFPARTPLEPEIDLGQLAQAYELTGGEIVNVVRHAALRAMSSSEKCITLTAILAGIRKEYQKEGRIFVRV